MSTVSVEIKPRITNVVSLTPRVTETVTLKTGAMGLPGAPGSDATVTSSNITSALGYTPPSSSTAIAFAIAL